MTTVINWGKVVKDIYFDDLTVGQCFQIASEKSKGAVYMKVVSHKVANTPALDLHSREHYQLELATAKLYSPTLSPVNIVNVSLNIDCAKPDLYS